MLSRNRLSALGPAAVLIMMASVGCGPRTAQPHQDTREQEEGLAVGQPCELTEDCAAGLMCVQNHGRSFEDDGLRCTVPAAKDEACNDTLFYVDYGIGPCAEGLVCSPTNVGGYHRCRAPEDLEPECQDDDDCDEGLVCGNECRRTCQPPLSEGGTCASTYNDWVDGPHGCSAGRVACESGLECRQLESPIDEYSSSSTCISRCDDDDDCGEGERCRALLSTSSGDIPQCTASPDLPLGAPCVRPDLNDRYITEPCEAGLICLGVCSEPEPDP